MPLHHLKNPMKLELPGQLENYTEPTEPGKCGWEHVPLLLFLLYHFGVVPFQVNRIKAFALYPKKKLNKNFKKLVAALHHLGRLKHI